MGKLKKFIYRITCSGKLSVLECFVVLVHGISSMLGQCGIPVFGYQPFAYILQLINEYSYCTNQLAFEIGLSDHSHI